MRTIEVDENRQIRQISLKTNKYAGFYGLRLIDAQGNYIVDTTWSNFAEAYWVTKDIPEGEEIIGVKINKNLTRLGFILYKPSR